MKNATKHATTLKALAKKIVKPRKGDPVRYEPLEALVRGILSRDTPDEAVDTAIENFRGEYTDFNELRVATPLEISSLMGDGFADGEARAQELINMLHEVFHKEHATHLERLGALKPKEQRQFFKELLHTDTFTEAYVMTFGFDQPAMPIDDSLMAYLESQEVLEAGTTAEDAQKFVEAQLKGPELEGFYNAIRGEALKAHKAKAKKPAKKAKA